jgi:multidrug efflux pump subunit AcrB
MAFLQNPPPITIERQQFTTSVYQLTLQSADLKEIYAWDPRLDKMRTLPGFMDVNSDLQIASPQMTWISTATARRPLGVTPRADSGRALHRLRNRQVSTIYTPSNEYQVIWKWSRNISARPTRFRSSMSARRDRWFRSIGGETDALGRPAQRQPFRPACRRSTISFNLKPGFSLGDAADQVDAADSRAAHAPTISASFQGTVKEFQQSFKGLVDSADRRHSGDLHGAGDAV